MKSHLMFKLLISIGLFYFTINNYGQVSNKLSIDKLFHTYDYRSDRLGATQWFNNGSSYTILEKSPFVNGTDIVLYQSLNQDD